MSRCPDSTRIAAYLDDRLFEEERRVLEEHFATCESCWRAFADSVACIAEMRAEEEAAAAPPRRAALLRIPFPHGRRREMAAAAMLVLAVGVTGWWVRDRLAAPVEPQPSDQRASVVERRPVLPRFTGFDWKPRPEDRVRGAGAVVPAQPGAWRYMKMVDEARLDAGDSPSADQLQRLGTAYLLAGSTDEGLQGLERAGAAAPGDGRALSDLAAAYLARGIERDDGNDIAQAIETADRVLEAAPDLLEARFNRAVALQELPLPAEATKAWKAYLELDPRSQWANEAQAQLDALAKATVEAPSATQLRVEVVAAAVAADAAKLEDLVRAHRQEAREAFTLDLLPAWGSAVLGGEEAEAAARLESARRVAAEWKRQTDDESLLRQVEQIEASPGERERFARGHQALAEGIEALTAVRVEVATTALAAARRELPELSSARRWAELSSLACELYRRGPETALLDELASLVPSAEGDAPLSAHLAWLRGLLRLRRGEPQALPLFAQALAEFERLGEADHVLFLHNLSAQASALFGDLPRAWSHRRQMLAALPRLSHGERRFPLLLEPAIGAAYLEDRPHVAAAFLDELSAGAAPVPPRRATELELWRSRIHLKLGDGEAARSALRAANAWLWQVDDAVVQRRLAADLQAASGIAGGDSPSALASLSASIARMRKGAPDFRLAGLLLERARAYRRSGDAALAAADLREGIDSLLRQRQGEPMQGLLSERLSGGDALFEELIALELRSGATDRAFEVADQARSRSVALETSGTQQTSSLHPAENELSTLRALRERLEPGTVLLYFCLLEKEAILWRVDSAGAALVQLDASPAELSALSARLETDLGAGVWTSRSREVARLLYEELLTPARLGPEVRKLVIVPDGRLEGLPFAALIDPRSGRFVVEQQTIDVAPSGAAFLAAGARARQLWNRQPSALVVGNPRADRELYPDLQPLPAAADEARRVAQLYSRRELLLDERATRDAVLEKASGYDVLHFAGHAVVNTVDPSRSSLALARTGGGAEPGALFAFELSAARFEKTRVVVLAGCGTATGPTRSGSGTLSLARAFLAARVPSVVATLWPVADGPTVDLMTALHANLSRGDEPASALRAAQLALLRSREPALRSPATWAAFRALGG